MTRSFQTMVLIENKDGKFLLGKKLQKIGMDKFNGPGGKVEVETSGDGEAQADERREERLTEKIKDGAAREAGEETNLTIATENLETKAVLKIDFPDNNSIVLYVYKTDQFEGVPSVPKGERDKIESWNWYSKEDIADMIRKKLFLESDASWLPEVLAGKEIRGFITYKKKRRSFCTG